MGDWIKKRWKAPTVVLLAAVMAFSAYKLAAYHISGLKTAEEFEALRELAPNRDLERGPSPSPSDAPEPQPGESGGQETPDDRYGDIFKENSDAIGWISIDGTAIDYPVMQSPDRPNFYLNHNFRGEPSAAGVPYAAEACAIDPQSDNITIFGHHMKNGSMFGGLESYKDEAFYREHPLARFDTRAGFGSYEIIAAFKVYPEDFKYNQFVDAADGAEFDAYVARCKALSFYETGVGAVRGDKLITLSTCEYSRNDNRLVVVAKKIG
ncbi:MAG: class B sortase [Clostridiales Family XIII bacterium]|nr:class B sortase [Clostridiales Family XIII bacterium]